MGCQKCAVFSVDLGQSLVVEKPESSDTPDSCPFGQLEHYEGHLQGHQEKESDVLNYLLVLWLPSWKPHTVFSQSTEGTSLLSYLHLVQLWTCVLSVDLISFWLTGLKDLYVEYHKHFYTSEVSNPMWNETIPFTPEAFNIEIQYFTFLNFSCRKQYPILLSTSEFSW